MADDVVWSNYRYIFLVTYARSGSTLLQSLLNSCEGVQIRGENSGTLYHLYKAIRATETARKFGVNPHTKDVDGPWFGAFKIRPQIFENNMIGSFVRNVLAPDPGVKVTGFKEIRYNLKFIPKEDFAPYMDFLLAKFPGAKVIFNTRPAADVAKSSFVAKQNPHKVHEWIAEADQNFISYDATSDRTMLMRYDQFTKDHSLIHKMLDFLELDWDVETVERVFAKPLTHAKAGGPAD